MLAQRAVSEGWEESRLMSRSRLSEDQNLAISASALTFQKAGGLFQHPITRGSGRKQDVRLGGVQVDGGARVCDRMDQS